ncbi:hypothetical protein GCM10010299_29850 [Streptomyces tanashiensis]|nr:hypothetical protein GCM10010299_29850 [Streptomyces tanashiensis]
MKKEKSYRAALRRLTVTPERHNDGDRADNVRAAAALAASPAGRAAGRGGADRQDSDYVFTTRTGRTVEPMNLSRSFQRITEAAGLPRIRLHDARHGCATLLFAAGVPARVVREILGHSQIAVTMNIYTHVSDERRREAMGHMDRLLRRRRPE